MMLKTVWVFAILSPRKLAASGNDHLVSIIQGHAYGDPPNVKDASNKRLEGIIALNHDPPGGDDERLNNVSTEQSLEKGDARPHRPPASIDPAKRKHALPLDKKLVFLNSDNRNTLLYYPSFPSRTCYNDGNYPEHYLYDVNQYFFRFPEECCKAHFGEDDEDVDQCRNMKAVRSAINRGTNGEMGMKKKKDFKSIFPPLAQYGDNFEDDDAGRLDSGSGATASTSLGKKKLMTHRGGFWHAVGQAAASSSWYGAWHDIANDGHGIRHYDGGKTNKDAPRHGGGLGNYSSWQDKSSKVVKSSVAGKSSKAGTSSSTKAGKKYYRPGMGSSKSSKTGGHSNESKSAKEGDPTGLPTFMSRTYPTGEGRNPLSLATVKPSAYPTAVETGLPTELPTLTPSVNPAAEAGLPTELPTFKPSVNPTPEAGLPTELPTFKPSVNPAAEAWLPTELPTHLPARHEEDDLILWGAPEAVGQDITSGDVLWPLFVGISAIDTSAGSGYSLIVLANGTALAAGYIDSINHYRGHLGLGGDNSRVQEGVNEFRPILEVMRQLQTTQNPPKFDRVFAGVEYTPESGSIHSILLDRQGRAWATGNNEKGQLCIGDNEDRMVPELIPFFEGRIVDVAIGGEHTLLLDEFGNVWGCGSNSAGQLGLGEGLIETSVPTQVDNLSSITRISSGHSHSLFTAEDGIYFTGSNSYGQLCTDTGGESIYKPVIHEGDQRTAVSFEAIKESSFILYEDGSVSGCGRNDFGQLGDGGNLDQYIKAVELGDNVVRSLGVGPASQSVFFINKNGSVVFGTGLNDRGQLGVEDTMNKNFPTLVQFGSGSGKIMSSMELSVSEMHSIGLEGYATHRGPCEGIANKRCCSAKVSGRHPPWFTNAESYCRAIGCSAMRSSCR